jgi:hypothetical protein
MKIKSIQVGIGGSYFEVGKSGITAIEDNGAEYEDNVFVQYDIYKNEKRHATLVNLPVEVFYFDE